MAELKAGQEMDEEVARRVFGFTLSPRRTDSGESYWLYDSGHQVRCQADCSCVHWSAVPPYSSDITAAWQVVDKLLTVLPQQDIHLEHLEGSGWTVLTCFHREDGAWDMGEEWNGTAETAPLAICRAALAAVQTATRESKAG